MAIKLLSDEEIEAWTDTAEQEEDLDWSSGDAQRMLATIRHLKEQDSLGQILAMQRTFRERINAKLDQPNPEEIWKIVDPSRRDHLSETTLPIIEQRVDHYATCMSQEAAEIRDWTRWKEWSQQMGNKHPTIKVGTKEWLHEIRIEVIDQLCFLLNCAAWLGMFTPQIILRYYMEKVKENHARQDSGKY